MLTVAVVVEAVAILGLTVLVLGLLRSHALILKALHDLGAGLDLDRTAGSSGGGSGAPGPVPVELETGVVAPARASGTTAPGLAGSDLAGRTLLAFLSSGCSVCQSFWTEFAGPVDVPGGGRLVVVAKDDADESPSALARLIPPGLDVVRSSLAFEEYEVPGSPYFVYVDDGRIIGEGSATSWPRVSDLMAQAVADHELLERGAGGP